ncbi:uncharacterized protein EHS24_002920 [Apiotrichum porosum]|uniref:Uncharacterized protein n=1 Tax=Apiotrichum porosum TaxID=105984 RepID=A0A427XG38_9TREE|nr:uncharacterized protein EHS24_002920 [Apiotrichum porosum]RSH77855.1 hypothetical protein EHS24_002920 [Apiotrichum porosum]
MTNSAENKKSLGQYFTKHWNKKNVDAGTKPHEKDDEPWAPEYQMIDEPQYVKVSGTKKVVAALRNSLSELTSSKPVEPSVAKTTANTDSGVRHWEAMASWGAQR